MPLTTREEVKKLLQISSSTTTYDEIIDALIPKVQNLIVTKINSFGNPKVYIQNSTISFSKSAKKILDSESKFLESYFANGLDIVVRGSLYNDKCYSVKVALAGYLELNEYPVIDESAGEFITIQALNFPEDISMAAAEYIAHKLDKQRNVKSFSIGKYSETKITTQEIISVFAEWRDVFGGI